MRNRSENHAKTRLEKVMHKLSKMMPKWSQHGSKIDQKGCQKPMRKSMQNQCKTAPSKGGSAAGASAPLVVLSRHTLYLFLSIISDLNATLKTARRHRYADARPDLRRKRQPAAHAVPCISETAEKNVKYNTLDGAKGRQK